MEHRSQRENAGDYGDLRVRTNRHDPVISLATSAAFVFSLAVTFGYPGEALWWELATLVTIMMLGPANAWCWQTSCASSNKRGRRDRVRRRLPIGSRAHPPNYAGSDLPGRPVFAGARIVMWRTS